MSSTKIKNKHLVEKRNILNELRAKEMALQELRFFSIYLSKINARDPSTSNVKFSIIDFQKIMELGRLNIEYLKTITDSLLCKVINIPDGNGGYSGFQLFKKCKVYQDKLSNWYIEIDAHDEALPLMFEFKREYFSYELWNALQLKSRNQLRMYELLKQYETKGTRIISISDLKELLGVGNNEYPVWYDFRRYVLETCKSALEEYTDIKFKYEPYGKKGRGGKILNLKFYIMKNEDYKSMLQLEDFIDIQSEEILESDQKYIEAKKEMDRIEKIKTSFNNEHLSFLADACEFEFKETEMNILNSLILQVSLPSNLGNKEIAMYDYLRARYHDLNYQAEKRKIKNRFAYLRKIIEADIE